MQGAFYGCYNSEQNIRPNWKNDLGARVRSCGKGRPDGGFDGLVLPGGEYRWYRKTPFGELEMFEPLKEKIQAGIAGACHLCGSDPSG